MARFKQSKKNNQKYYEHYLIQSTHLHVTYYLRLTIIKTVMIYVIANFFEKLRVTLIVLVVTM